MSRKYKVGAVIAVIVGVCSFLLLVWTVLVWVMAASGDANVLVGGYGLALFAIFGKSFKLNATTAHMMFAGFTLFFLIGTWVNIHSAYQLSTGRNRWAGLPILLGVMSCVGEVVWVVFLVMCPYNLSKWEEYSRYFVGPSISVIVVSILALVGIGLTGSFLFTQSRERRYHQGTSSYPGASPMYSPLYQGQPVDLQPFNQSPEPQIFDPQPFTPPPDSNKTQPFDPQQQQWEEMPQPLEQQMGRVRVTEGRVRSERGFQICDGYKIVVGKSAQNASLVIDDPHISNVHCSIRYDAKRNMYIVRDHSTNGTVVRGERLPKDVPVQYPAGTTLSLANGAARIALG